MKISVTLAGVRSIHEQYRRPRCAPFDRSTSSDGYTSAPRNDSAGITISNGSVFREIVSVTPQLRHVSYVMMKTIPLATQRFYTTYNSTLRQTTSDEPSERPSTEGS